MDAPADVCLVVPSLSRRSLAQTSPLVLLSYLANSLRLILSYTRLTSVLYCILIQQDGTLQAAAEASQE